MSNVNGNLIVSGDVTAGGVFINFKPETLANDPEVGTLTAPTDVGKLHFENSETVQRH